MPEMNTLRVVKKKKGGREEGNDYSYGKIIKD